MREARIWLFCVNQIVPPHILSDNLDNIQISVQELLSFDVESRADSLDLDERHDLFLIELHRT